jgi:hypothetical protein
MKLFFISNDRNRSRISLQRHSGSSARSFEQCQDIAVSRGIPIRGFMAGEAI